MRSKKSTFLFESRGVNETYGELIDSRLEDLFQSKDNGSRREKMMSGNSRNKFEVKINGIDLDLSNIT